MCLKLLLGERGQEKVVLIIDDFLFGGLIFESFFVTLFDETFAVALALQSFNFLFHVLSLWLVGSLGSSPLELANVNGREENSINDHAGNVNGEPLKITKISAISVLSVNVHQRVDVHGVATVAEDPEAEELDSEELVAILQFLSFGSIRSDSVLTGSSRSRSVTPRDVVEVAHCVDLEDVGEGWEQEDVADHADEVRFPVVDEVEWSHHEGDEVNHQHDYSADGEDLDVVSVGGFDILGI